ncbi:MAG: cache domain-containing protein [Thermodesulfobacteriota bacterium]|nr:cache domain-containing protein [Thermodesulfobacteriota bacterium]
MFGNDETGNWKLEICDTSGKRRFIRLSCRQGASARLFLIVVLSLLIMAPNVHAQKNAYDWALVSLDYARREKVQQLRQFCERMHDLAQKAAVDESVINCFEVIRQYRALTGRSVPPQPLLEKIRQMKDTFNQYYIEHYFSFYDLLFVNLQGDIFYTIRKETDMNQNLFGPELAATPLGRCLAEKPEQGVFVDFHAYGPSAEPAAFFVEPVLRDGTHTGWIILQCAINKANTIFAWTEDLGKTGETFLVNQEGFMLTDSNFQGDSTVLKKHLDDRNIQAKFTEGEGHRTVTDYRGEICLTSFEVVNFMDTKWLVVAKVDKGEVVTRYFTRHRRYYGDRLLENLKKSPLPWSARNIEFSTQKAVRRVDMDEFLKAGDGEYLQTQGVATCTGFIVTYPGRFAYLAHISPRDKVYSAASTNLLGQVLKKVESFDVRPFEKSGLTFVVVATHLNSMLPIIDKLIEEGYLLNQIQVMYNPQARSASIGYDCETNDLKVTWYPEKADKKQALHSMEDTCNAGAVIEQVMYSESGMATGNTNNVVAVHQ